MTRLITDGAETGINGLFVKSVTIETERRRTGNYAYALGWNVNNSIVLPNNVNEIYVRFGFLFTNSGAGMCSLLQWRANSGEILGAIRFEAGGSNKFYVSVTSSVTTYVIISDKSLSSNQWFFVEVHIKIADNGVIEAKVDNEPFVIYEGKTNNGSSQVFNTLYIQTANGMGFIFDDVAVNDINGNIDNSWCGDGHIIAIFPNANGDSSQFIGNDLNSVDNYLLVDENLNDGDTTFVESDVPGEKDLYNLAPSGLVDSKILRTWVEVVAKDTTTGNGQIKTLTKIGSTEHESNIIPLSLIYRPIKGTEYLLNPSTSAPWTLAQLEALQIGVKVVN